MTAAPTRLGTAEQPLDVGAMNRLRAVLALSVVAAVGIALPATGATPNPLAWRGAQPTGR